jgi:hypothetical protein
MKLPDGLLKLAKNKAASLRLLALLALSRVFVRLPRLMRLCLRREPVPLDAELQPKEMPTVITLGAVSIDTKILARQLRNDLRDDWFPDPLQFGDMLNADALAQLIRKNIAFHLGEYRPSARTLLNIPKTGFTLRYALETSLSDRALYQGLTAFLIPFYDRLLPWNSFSHRYDYERRRSNDKYTFKNGIQSWKHYVKAARSAVTTDSYLLSTDVANFFENIQLERLRADIEALESELIATPAEMTRIRAHKDLLFKFLEQWTYEQGVGLPQNRDASSFLANIYMRRLDLEMIAAGYADTYFRYMDDIKIVCTDQYHARKALKQLTVCLRALGLSVNSRKTEIVAGFETSKVEECLDGGSEVIERIDELWRRRTRSAIFALWPTLRDRTLELIEKGSVDSREFRYCIKRIELLATFEDLHFPKELYAAVTTAICRAVAIYPACTDQYVKYLSAVHVTAEQLQPVIEYLCQSDQSIYTWQNYRLWLLLAAKGIATEKLMGAALGAVNGPDTPLRAGASVYLGALGHLDSKIAVARQFGSATSFMGQRSALIAIHELPFRQIDGFVRPHMRPDLQGVYKGLAKRERKGSYFAPREVVRIDFGGEEEVAYE